jgi:hypothetical protein
MAREIRHVKVINTGTMLSTEYTLDQSFLSSKPSKELGSINVTGISGSNRQIQMTNSIL